MVRKDYACGDGIVFPEGGWSFNGKVSSVFQAHAGKSIPLYKYNHELVEMIAECLYSKHKGKFRVLDVGCSTGELEIDLNNYFGDCITVDAIDTSEDMINLCLAYGSFQNSKNYKFQCCELSNTKFRNKYDLIVILYTLQFIKDIEGFAKSLKKYIKKDSVVVIADKFVCREPLKNFLYTQFKMKNYTKEEIKGKEKALKNIQNPVSYGVIDYLSRSLGLYNFEQVLQCYQFRTYVLYGRDFIK